MKQRRPGEVAVGGLEIGPRMDELGMLRQQLLEATEISGNERGDRLVECRVGFELRDALARLDFVFEGRPTLEAVFAGDDELGVGERELCAEYGGRRRAFQSRMIGDDPRCGGLLALAMELSELVGLTLELGEVGTRREGTSRHVRSFLESPMSAARAERSVTRFFTSTR